MEEFIMFQKIKLSSSIILKIAAGKSFSLQLVLANQMKTVREFRKIGNENGSDIIFSHTSILYDADNKIVNHQSLSPISTRNCQIIVLIEGLLNNGFTEVTDN